MMMIMIALTLYSQESAWYRQIRFDGFDRVRGVYPIDERASAQVNCYRFTMDGEDRPVLIEYLNRGRALDDPERGVLRMELVYGEGFTERIHQTRSGQPAADFAGCVPIPPGLRQRGPSGGVL